MIQIYDGNNGNPEMIYSCTLNNEDIRNKSGSFEGQSKRQDLVTDQII